MVKRIARELVKKIAEKTESFREGLSFRGFNFPRELHNAAQPFFSRYGYELQVMEFGTGEQARKMGLWRKKFRDAIDPKRLFVVPGLGDTPLSWLMVFVPLRHVVPEHYDEIVFVDYPGFGGFLANERAFTSFDDLIAAMGKVFQEFRPETIIAHSLGSWVTAHYSVKYSSGTDQFLKRVVFVSSPAAIPSREQIIEWRAKFDLAKSQGVEEFRKYLFVNEPVFFPFFTKEFTEFFKKKDILEFIDSIGYHHFLNDQLHQIRHGVILLWGKEDQLNLASWSEAWLRSLDAARTGPIPLVLIHGVGHNLHLENTATTATVIGKILMGHELTHSHKWDLEIKN